MVSKRPCPSPMTAKMVFRSAHLSQKENVYPIPLKPNHHREGCSMLPHPDRASHARKFVPLRCVKSPVDRLCSTPCTKKPPLCWTTFESTPHSLGEDACLQTRLLWPVPCTLPTIVSINFCPFHGLHYWHPCHLGGSSIPQNNGRHPSPPSTAQLHPPTMWIPALTQSWLKSFQAFHAEGTSLLGSKVDMHGKPITNPQEADGFKCFGLRWLKT